jgi:predicted extracellular nuclease
LRKQAANVIIDSLLTLSTPFVVLGDMNDVVGSPALCVFKDAGFTDAWWECGTG